MDKSMVPNTSTLKLSVLTTAMPPSLLVGVGPLVAAVSDEPACFAGSAFFSVSTGTGATTAVALPVPFSGGVVCTAGSSFFSVSAGGGLIGAVSRQNLLVSPPPDVALFKFQVLNPLFLSYSTDP